MWEKADVIAILLADIHLSLEPPIWRSAEPNWLTAQCRVLEQLRELKEEYKCPIICAGDVFDRNKRISDGWNAPPELINFAIEYLPEMWAIPGQHDLPNHQYKDIHRSAYWTLVRAGKIININPRSKSIGTNKNQKGIPLLLSGFPPGYKIEQNKNKTKCLEKSIAVVHDYVWIPGHSYPKAPKEKRLKGNSIKNNKWMGYDVIVYGDNHKGFQHRIGATEIFNCGSFMRRKSDEVDYRPRVGLLLSTGKIAVHFLDTSSDKHLNAIKYKIIEKTEKAKLQLDNIKMSKFLKELEMLGETALDFKAAMEQFLETTKTVPEVKEIILEAMGKSNVKA